jgi:hypothetical protein
MPSITVDPLPEAAFSGLKDPSALQRAFNRLQEECAVLNGRLTPDNLSRLLLAEKELVTPSDWLPLALENGFQEFGPTAYGAVAVRKQADGRVELRERVKRPSGSPSLFTTILSLPAEYTPFLGVRRAADANGSHGAYDVLPTGEVRWLSGDPTSEFSFCGGSWVANDRSIPTWATPFRVALPTAKATVRIREVLVVARAAKFDGYGLPVPCTVYQPTVVRDQNGGSAVLSIPRIDGLQPEQRYKLTLWAFTE